MSRRAALAVLIAAGLAVPAGAEVDAARWPGVETTVSAPADRGRDAPAWPVTAALTDPTDRYDHGVLGGIPPYATLQVTAVACGSCRNGYEAVTVNLPEDMVFEDVAPRLWDVTGDGRPEVVVVETHVARGARLALWEFQSEPGNARSRFARIATTAFIGQPQRWLAPAGAGDFDGDGRIELAYVDRPHLKQDLVFVRPEGDRLKEIARLPGYSNHAIGDTVISSGHRNCGAGDEVVLPDAAMARLLAVRIGAPPRDLGAFSSAALARALACR